MARVLPISPRATVVLQMVAIAAAYYVAAKVGLQLAIVRGQVTPLWAPTGIALAALLLWGLRTWPGIAVGAFLVNLPIGPTLLTVGAITFGNTAAPVVAYLLLTRYGLRPSLDRLTDALRLVFFGALASSVVSATIGTFALMESGAVPFSQFWTTWSVWWTGDAMGMLLVAPLLLVYSTGRWPALRRGFWWLEAAVLLGACLAVATLIGQGRLQMFLAFPLLVWAAVRFRHFGATLCAVIVSTGAIAAAADRFGEFAGQDTLTTMVTLQAFNGTVALTGLLLAAVITERDRAYGEITSAVAQVSAALAQQPLASSRDRSLWRSLGRITDGEAPPAVSRPGLPPE